MKKQLLLTGIIISLFFSISEAQTQLEVSNENSNQIDTLVKISHFGFDAKIGLHFYSYTVGTSDVNSKIDFGAYNTGISSIGFGAVFTGGTNSFGDIALRANFGTNDTVPDRYALLATGSRAGFFSGDIEYTGSLLGPISDRRLKQNIASFSGALEKIQNLEVYSYEYIDNHMNLPEGENIGFMAQELQEEFPNLVVQTHDPDSPNSPDARDVTAASYDPNSEGAYLTINYMAMIPVLAQAIKEQTAVIEALQADNKELLQRIESLEKK